MPTIENEKAYPSKYRRKFILQVEVFLDGVPGGFNQLEDHVSTIFQLPYVSAIGVPDSAMEHYSRKAV